MAKILMPQGNIPAIGSDLVVSKDADAADEQQALRQAAEQFESLFVNMMMKSMRAASRTLSEGNYLNSFETQMYEDMLDEKLSVHMSGSGSLGIADLMMDQLSPNVKRANYDLKMTQSSTAPGSSTSSDSSSNDKNTKPTNSLIENLAPIHSLSTIQAVFSRPALSKQAPAGSGSTAIDKHDVAVTGLSMRQIAFDDAGEFVAKLLPATQIAAAELEINPKFILAQAALETGWGKHMIFSANGQNSHNLFGIKANGSWQGETVAIESLEVNNGVAQQQRSLFKVYDDYPAALKDYAALIQDNPRYSAVQADHATVEHFGQALVAGGYATDPDYAQKLQRVISNPALSNIQLAQGVN